MIKTLTAVAGVAGLLLVGCGSDDSSDEADETEAAATIEGTTTEETATTPTQEPTTAPKPAATGIKIKTANSQFGTILFDGADQAIYYFDKERTKRSECYEACAAAWPPVLTDGAPRAVEGAKAGLLGTTKRDDGTTQVTYDGHPLYYYVDDPPGEVLCHNVSEFGGLWLVVEPSGQPVA